MKKGRLINILLLTLFPATLSSCDNAKTEDDSMYNLSYTSTDGGYVAGFTSQQVFENENGEEVVAVVNNGYQFIGWSDGKSEVNRTDANIKSDLSVVAKFEVQNYTLKYKADTGGHFIINDKIKTEYTEKVQSTNPVKIGSIEAIANEGYHFVKWSDDVLDTSRVDKYITSDVTLTAQFALNDYTFVYQADAGGTILANDENKGNSYSVDTKYNSECEVTAVPDAFSEFVAWSDGVETITRTDIIKEAGSVTAIFKPKTYVVNAASAITELDESYPHSNIIIKTVDYALTKGDLVSLFSRFEDVDLAEAMVENNSLSTKMFEQNSSTKYFITKNLILPTSLVEIGDSAFKKCESLESIYIHDDVVTIKDSAFYNCKNLSTVRLPNNETYTNISTSTFYNSGIEVVTYDVEATKGLMLNDNIDTISKDAFKGSKLLISVYLKDTIKVIGESAFSGCSTLEYVRLPNNEFYTSIDNNTFENTSKLEEISYDENLEKGIIFNESITSLSSKAFMKSGLKKVFLKDSILDIQEYAFSDCKSLVYVRLPQNDEYTVIAKNTFYNNALTEITYSQDATNGAVINDNIVEFSDNSFTGCFITSLHIGKNLKSLGENKPSKTTSITDLFSLSSQGDSELHNLTYTVDSENEYFQALNGALYSKDGKILYRANITDTLELYSDVEEIAAFALSYSNVTEINGSNVSTIGVFSFANSNITEINLPNVTSIPREAFVNCKSLININDFSSNITEVGISSFKGCDSLEEINMPLLIKIGSRGFEGCSALKSVYTPLVEVISEYAFYNNLELSIFNVNEQGYNEVPLTIKNIEQYAFSKTGLTDLHILKPIGTDFKLTTDYLFYYSEKLEFVVLPLNIKTIGKYAFSNCSELAKVSFGTIDNITGKEVTEIGNYGLDGSRVSKINLPNIKTIGNYAFRNTSLVAFNMDDDGYNHVPTNTSKIGNSAFVGSKIRNIIINSNLTIDKYAFKECMMLGTIIFKTEKPIISADALKDSNVRKIYILSGSKDYFSKQVGLKEFIDILEEIQ